MKDQELRKAAEEAAEEWIKGWGGLSNSKQSFIEGTNWQAERMYSEEDMKKAFKVGFSVGYGSDTYATEEKDKTCEEWFERIKK